MSGAREAKPEDIQGLPWGPGRDVYQAARVCVESLAVWARGQSLLETGCPRVGGARFSESRDSRARIEAAVRPSI